MASSFDICDAHPERELVSDSARASELLVPLTSSSITHVKLSNKSYTIEAAECVAEKMRTLDSVVSVDISDVIAGRPEAEALQVLKALASSFEARAPELTALDVSDNALGQKGIDSLLPLLQAPALHELHVCNNGMSAAAAEQLETLVAAEALEKLQYHNNMSGDGGAFALAKIIEKATSLKDLRFSGTRAGRPGSLAVAKSLSSVSMLTKLDLADNVLGTEGGEAIAAFLKIEPPLEHLSLRDCALGDEGWEPVAEALVSSKQLTHLDVSGNELTKDASFPSLPRPLETLLVEENELGSGGARALAKSLARHKHDSMVTFNASFNEIGSKAAVILCTVLKTVSPNLKAVYLDGNFCDASTLELLPTILGEDVDLGSMDDNDEDGEEEEEEEDEEGVDDLVNMTAHLGL